MTGHLHRSANELSESVGRDITDALAAMDLHGEALGGDRLSLDGASGRGYRIVLEGFSAGEASEVEEFLVVFHGYRQIRPIETNRDFRVYWYETSSNRARLNRNLTKMLTHIDLEGEVSFREDSFTIAKTAGGSQAKEWDAW